MFERRRRKLAWSDIVVFKLSEFRFDMRESAFQHCKVTAHISSLHFSNDPSPFEQQSFLSFELFELMLG